MQCWDYVYGLALETAPLRQYLKQINRTYCIMVDSVLDEARELFLVGLFILLHQVFHVLRDVQAHDVLAVDLCIELLAFSVIARETFGAKGKFETFIC